MSYGVETRVNRSKARLDKELKRECCNIIVDYAYHCRDVCFDEPMFRSFVATTSSSSFEYQSYLR